MDVPLYTKTLLLLGVISHESVLKAWFKRNNELMKVLRDFEQRKLNQQYGK